MGGQWCWCKCQYIIVRCLLPGQLSACAALVNDRGKTLRDLSMHTASNRERVCGSSGCSSFDGEDLVPLTAIHKAGSAARSASSVGARTCSAPTAIAAAESPSASTSEQPPSQTPPQASSTKGSGGAHAKEVGEAPVKPVPRTIRRPDLDSASLQWFCASDSHVQRVGWDAVAACEAYILMYVRVR